MRLFESAILLTLNSVDHCTMCGVGVGGDEQLEEGRS